MPRLCCAAIGALISLLIIPLPAKAQVAGIANTLVQQAINKIQNEITRQAGEAMGLGSPLLLDQHTAFAEAPAIKDFNPIPLSPTTEDDLGEPLVAGDYSVPVTAFCTQWSIHQPGQGLPYKIARVQGKAATAISALIVRGSLQHIPPSTINAEAWRIEDGLPISQWPDQDRALIDKLIPDHEKDLDGDFLQQARDIYDKNINKKVMGARIKIPGMPSFDEVMQRSGDIGKMVLSLEGARKTLSDKTLSAEHLPEMLYQPSGDGLPFTLPANPDGSSSPWAEVKPGIFARFTVIQGNLGTNRFEFRITPAAVQAASLNPSLTNASFTLASTAIPISGPTLGKILGIIGLLIPGIGEVEGLAIAAEIGDELYIAYSEGKSAQALILMIQMSGSGHEGAKPAPKEGPKVGGARRVNNKGSGRTRWQGGDGKLYEWDSQHGEWEVYNDRGQHLGTMDTNGNFNPGNKVPGRTTPT